MVATEHHIDDKMRTWGTPFSEFSKQAEKSDCPELLPPDEYSLGAYRAVDCDEMRRNRNHLGAMRTRAVPDTISSSSLVKQKQHHTEDDHADEPGHEV
jgi:hypothetical protein